MVQGIDFAALVEALRTAKGLPPEEFAQAPDLTTGAMNNCEKGEYFPLEARRKRLQGTARLSPVLIPAATGDRGSLGPRSSPEKAGHRWRN